jgi:hypothetical protein
MDSILCLEKAFVQRNLLEKRRRVRGRKRRKMAGDQFGPNPW